MAVIDDLSIRILADGSQLEGGLNKAREKVDHFSEGITKLGHQLTEVFSVIAIEEFIRGSVEAADEAARALAKVAQALKTTAGVSGKSLEMLKIEAEDIQGITLFKSDTVLNDVTAQMLTFSAVSGETFKRAQMAALDLATVLGDGEGLKGITIQLGKALQDPVKGITALQRSGVSFTPVQRELIKNFAETNQLAAAQNIILEEVERQYGGQAEAAAEASNGMKQFGNELHGVSEKIGSIITGGGVLKSVLEAIGAGLTLAFDKNIPGSILFPFADHNEYQTKVLGSEKKDENAPAQEEKINTYDDEVEKLKSLQAAFKESTLETRAGLSAQIEQQKLVIKAWEDSGKAVVDYSGSIKGLDLEIAALNDSRSTIQNDPAAVAAIGEIIEKKKEEKKELENASVAWVEYGKMVGLSVNEMVGNTFPKMENSIKATFDHVHDLTDKRFKEITDANTKFSQEISNSIKSAIGSIASSIGVMIGDLVNGSKSAGDTLLTNLGKMVGQVGQMAIAIGSSMLAIQLTLSNPENPAFAIGLIAAGVAAVALGQIFANTSKSIASGGSASGTYSSSSTANTYDTRAAQASIPSEIKLVLDGRDLTASIKLNQLYYSRQG